MLSVLTQAAKAFREDTQTRYLSGAEQRLRTFIWLLKRTVSDNSRMLFKEVLRLAVTDPALIGEERICALCSRKTGGEIEAWPYWALKHCYTREHEANLDRVVAEGRIGHLFVRSIENIPFKGVSGDSAAEEIEGIEKDLQGRGRHWGTRDVGPTDACWECGNLVAVADLYLSTRDEYKALCPTCFQAAETAGRAKEREEE